MGVLKVKGVGSVTKKPDLVVIRFRIISENLNYDETIKDMNAKADILRKDLVGAGYQNDDLKTVDFRIETKYDYIKEKNTFAGYRAILDSVLEFAFDPYKLNKTIRTIASSESVPEFRIVFEVKDKAALKRELLELAVKNAKMQAEVLSRSSDIKTGKILNIYYDNPDLIYRSNSTIEGSPMLKSSNFEIVPSDVENKDFVTIEWEII